jgi:hypothetical protein
MTDKITVVQEFEIAWKWFDLHAKQRQTNIQFGITLIGALFASIGYCMQAGLYSGSLIIALFGILCCFVFHGIDRRNSSLVKCSESVLKDIFVSMDKESNIEGRMNMFSKSERLRKWEIKYSTAAFLIFGSAAVCYICISSYSIIKIIYAFYK